MAIMSGHGSALTFGTTSTFSPSFTSLGGLEVSRESLDTSGLATAGARTQIGGDLYTVSPMTHTYLLDPSTLASGGANSIDDLLFDSSAVSASEEVTITLANSEASTIAGDAHITGFAMEDLATDQLIAATITLQFDAYPTITE